MIISAAIFEAYLKCPSKCWFLFLGKEGDANIYSDFVRNQRSVYHAAGLERLMVKIRQSECGVMPSAPVKIKTATWLLAVDFVATKENLESRLHAVERVPSNGQGKPVQFIPIRFIYINKLTRGDKLMLAFDALVLSEMLKIEVSHGKIIYGHSFTTLKIKISALTDEVRKLTGKMAKLLASKSPPDLILNRHCAECEYQARCRQKAIDKDDLSLLAGMTEKERKKLNSKGIFTVTQLSYTFRPRRRPKRRRNKCEKYHHSLKALAIRENKIHIIGNQELNITRNPVYLDVEGLPDQDFYYLIGLRIKDRDTYVQQTFWADRISEERDIFISFIESLSKVENPQLFHYGRYETVFLKRMKERYSELVENPEFLDQLIAQSVNLLSVIYAQIYFPTYSNGLKEVAQHLGFKWSQSNVSGRNALIWRSEWERSKDPSLKKKVITYNAEDCEAAERVVSALAQLCQKPILTVASIDNYVVYADTLKRPHPYRWEKDEFSTLEFEFINRAAYWDYQREKIYVRSCQWLKHVTRKSAKGRIKALSINKVVKYKPSCSCPKCNSTNVINHKRRSKIVHDIKFGRTGIKRWIVKYLLCSYSCCQCGTKFYPPHITIPKDKYGTGFTAYVTFNIIELAVTQESVTKSLNQLCKFRLGSGQVNPVKSKAARFYKPSYESLLNKISSGDLIHADETRANIQGKSAYVWVFTNLEEVAFVYTETREADMLQELLRNFKGVLVSDFYAAYDSINCPQQKCLIHLMRDLNNDLFREPYNKELKDLVQTFGGLLKPMIETVDRFGLKTFFLRKHKVFVERFHKRLSSQDYKSETAVKYKKRFEKNRDKLFTFLDYDCVPWNNNNAEHAIKAFARIRSVIKGTSTEKGFRDYLILLSICETCRYKGVNFLHFLHSGGKDIDEFIKKKNGGKAIET